MQPTPTHAVHRAELLAVGTELLLGEIVDTNSAWLAQRLADRSVDVLWSQRVGDNRGRITEALRGAVARSDLVVLSGGLGPTDDDLTREAIADLLGETPAVDPTLEADLRAYFARSRRTMPERNLKQAWLVPSVEALPNPNGTAPGWFARVPAARAGGRPAVVVALPGPPRELLPMWTEQVEPRLAFPTARFVARTFKTYGLGESHVAERLAAWTEAGNPSVATYAKRDGVHVRVAAKAGDEAAARSLLDPVADAVASELGEHVWGEDGHEMAGRALDALVARGGRVALVDRTSGGLLATLLAEAAADDPVRSEALSGAVIAWRDDALAVLEAPHAPHAPSVVRAPERAQKLPGSDPDPATAHEGWAEAMALAQAARARFGVDHGVALTPWVGTADLADERPSWTASWAVVGPQGALGRALTLPQRGRGWRDERLAFAALFGLWSLTKT
jgi:nicotinamide-nucleotide amidase